MNETENKDDSIFSDLIKKSLVKVPSDDFTDRLMEKIEAEKATAKPSFLNFRLSWLFFIVSIVLVPVSLRLITGTFHQPILTKYADKISPVLLVMFSLIVLLQLDNLLKSFFSRKNQHIVE